jgi:hypothetical protein
LQESGALVRRRPAPRAVDGPASGLDGAVDVRLARQRRAGQWLAGRGLVQVASLARRGLDDLAPDEEPVLLSGGNGHYTELSG